MRKNWWKKLLILIGFFISWYYADNIHLMVGNTIGNLYFMLYLFILGIFLVESLAWRTSDGTW